MLVFAEIIYSITDPPLRLLRKVLRPVRVGNMMLDLAFIGLAILVSILMQINASIFFRSIAPSMRDSARNVCSLRKFGTVVRMGERPSRKFQEITRGER